MINLKKLKVDILKVKVEIQLYGQAHLTFELLELLFVAKIVLHRLF